jgi:hypothetical protein
MDSRCPGESPAANHDLEVEVPFAAHFDPPPVKVVQAGEPEQRRVQLHRFLSELRGLDLVVTPDFPVPVQLPDPEPDEPGARHNGNQDE